MGVWKSENTVITENGMQFLADIAGKVPLTFTRAVAGSDYTAPAELARKTEITHAVMDLHFSEIGKNEDSSVYVDVYLENSSVEEGFYHQQIGLYAKGTGGNDVLFLIAQVDSPDYIPEKGAYVYITHRIFLKFSGHDQVEVHADFSGVVSQEMLREELAKKEDAFDKNNAFNRNFSDEESDYMPLAKKAYPGGSSSVARADHVHPLGTMLRFAENHWESGGLTNLLPDTNRWVMSNGRTPDVWSGYAFEATFTSAWEGFSCFFDAELLEQVKGKTVEFGVERLEGASSRLELVVDGGMMPEYILATETPASAQATIPLSASSVTLRIIVFSDEDLHCAFSGVYLHDKAEKETAADDGKELYLTVRKVRQEKLPESGTGGTLYITEKGNLYLAADDGTLLPLAGNAAP